MSPASKAQQKAVNKYMKSNYDRVNLVMPKGKKDIIQAHAAQQGESVNAYINRAIDEAMQRDDFASYIYHLFAVFLQITYLLRRFPMYRLCVDRR